MLESEIKELIREVPGMSNARNLLDLYTQALSTRDVDGAMLEIGTWCGRSAIVLQKAAALLKCHLYCLDTFPPFEWWEGKTSIPIMQQVLAPIYRAGGPEIIARRTLEPFANVTVLKGDEPPARALRFAFIDGDHRYQGVARNIRQVVGAINSGGVVVLDDVHNSYVEVKHALHDSALMQPELFRNLGQLNPKMHAFQRI